MEFRKVDQRPGEVKGNDGAFGAATQGRGRKETEGREGGDWRSIKLIRQLFAGA